MSKRYEDIYTQNYYDQYSVGNGHEGYEDSKYTKDFLKNIAGRIYEDRKPESVLDVGCAMGYLVEALRDLGVEAYGVDVSEYAISKVREDLKPFCKAASALEELPEDFPRHFDLVTAIEVAEHLYEEDSDLFFDHLCSWGDQVVFSSTDDDYDEPTHVNVQKIEYWTKKFAKEAFTAIFPVI